MRDCPNEAWVTFALHDQDVYDALTFSFSLKRVLTTKKLAVMTSSKLSPFLKQALHHGFDFVFYLQDDLNTSGLPETDFVKLSALTLASFGKILFLSPKMMVLRNCDELFDLETNEDEVDPVQKENDDVSIFLAKPCFITYTAVLEALKSNNGLTKTFLQRHMESLSNHKVMSIGRKTVVG
ncbi:unnamed protein product [Orchesella dallaii]|uniref:Uncharacterized protein n=1 Tax=Orchesella dallaii TaxID=48710 RepID=A0ABP1Q270_9HEXA